MSFNCLGGVLLSGAVCYICCFWGVQRTLGVTQWHRVQETNCRERDLGKHGHLIRQQQVGLTLAGDFAAMGAPSRALLGRSPRLCSRFVLVVCVHSPVSCASTSILCLARELDKTWPSRAPVIPLQPLSTCNCLGNSVMEHTPMHAYDTCELGAAHC